MGQELTSLHEAAGQGDRRAVEAFLARGVSVDAVPNKYCGTPLANAARHGRLATVKLMLALGANLNGNKHGTPLEAAIVGHQPEVAIYLLDQGADWSRSDRLLDKAIANGLPDVAEALIQRGASSGAEEAGEALQLASSHGQLGVVECLLAHGTAVDVRNPRGETPLHLAAKEGRLEVVRRLLSAGADVSSVDDHQRTALHLAAGAGRHEVAQALLQGGAEVDARDVRGATPLHMAVSNRIVSPTTKILILFGADPGMPDFFGNTVLQRAGNDIRLLAILQQARASSALAARHADAPDRQRDADEDRGKALNYVARRVTEVIASARGVGTSSTDVLPTIGLVRDLGFDSISTVALVMDLEEEFGVEISDEEVDRMQTASDATDLVLGKLLPPSKLAG